MKEKLVRVYAVNIKMHPPEGKPDYYELFDRCFKSRLSARLYGEDYALIGRLEEKDWALIGTLFRFVDIRGTSWLDLKALSPAEEIKVPDHLKPNLRRIPFVFALDVHRLFWFDRSIVQGSPSPKVMCAFLKRLFAYPYLKLYYGEVDVEIETKQEVLSQILKSFKSFKRIDIRISLPNGDTLEDLEEEYIEDLRKQNIKRVHTTYTSHQGKGINPGSKLETEMRIACSGNGRLEAEGIREDGSIERVASDKHPYEFTFRSRGKPSETDLFSKVSEWRKRWKK